jgi:predicted RNA-binding Zn-ribbon protein involved in translation (DUF1610 family)
MMKGTGMSKEKKKMIKQVIETIECPACGAWGARYSKCQNIGKVRHSIYCKWCGFEDWWDEYEQEKSKPKKGEQ